MLDNDTKLFFTVLLDTVGDVSMFVTMYVSITGRRRLCKG